MFFQSESLDGKRKRQPSSFSFLSLSFVIHSPTTARRSAGRSSFEPRPTPKSTRCCLSDESGRRTTRGESSIDHSRRRREGACPRASTSRGRCLLVEQQQQQQQREHRSALMKTLRRRRGRRAAGAARGAKTLASRKRANSFSLLSMARVCSLTLRQFLIAPPLLASRYASTEPGVLLLLSPPPLRTSAVIAQQPAAERAMAHRSLAGPSEQNAEPRSSDATPLAAKNGFAFSFFYSLSPWTSMHLLSLSLFSIFRERRKCAPEAPTRDESNRTQTSGKKKKRSGGRKSRLCTL